MASIIDVVTNSACHCFDGLTTEGKDGKEGKEGKRAQGHSSHKFETQKGALSSELREVPPQMKTASNEPTNIGRQFQDRVWSENVRCGEHLAKELLQQYVDKNHSSDDAKNVVMEQFPDSFQLVNPLSPDSLAQSAPGVLDKNAQMMAEFQKRMEQMEQENKKLKQDNVDLSAFADGNHRRKRSHRSKQDDEGSDVSDCESVMSDSESVTSEVSSRDESDDQLGQTAANQARVRAHHATEHKVFTNAAVLMHSAAAWTRPMQIFTYTLAAAGVVFVLIAPAFTWGQPEHRRLQLEQAAMEEFGYVESDFWPDSPWRALSDVNNHSGNNSNSNDSGSHGSGQVPALGAGHSSSGGGGDGSSGGGGHGSSGGECGGHQLIVNIAYCTVSAGLIALIVHVLDQPLLLGYILGGVLVGPIGLGLIKSAVEINTISELGLILLLFMIGLELDISELLKMGKVVIATGMIQFPICCTIHMAAFMALDAIGIGFGEGQYATQYMAVCCGISSTMIVVKLLGQKMETDTAAGRLTIGILIFQDMWAIIVMAIQPNLANPEILGILKTFGMMLALLVIAFAYSKYVLPAIFQTAATSLELLLILSMAWCFFVCCIALLPFFNLSMELAALIAGASMATYPYSAELNGKIKYIRDFFITLYFVSLGMQIPSPTFEAVYKSLLTCVIVLSVRWVGLFLVVEAIERDDRLAVVATMNLSEVSEFGLVLCSMGKKYGHVTTETFTYMIWTFSILAVSASYFIKYNHSAYVVIHRFISKLRPRANGSLMAEEEDDDGHCRDIVLLGFGKIANALMVEVQERCPALLSRMHVIDASMKYKLKIEKKGVTFAYGDVGSEDVLQHAMPHGEDHIKLVLITQPDSQLGKHTNGKIMTVVRGLPCCREAKVICTAEHTPDIDRLYSQGANYVLKMVKLGAERLADMLEQYAHGMGNGEFNKDMRHDIDLNEVLRYHAQGDKTRERRVSEVLNEHAGQMPKKSLA